MRTPEPWRADVTTFLGGAILLDDEGMWAPGPIKQVCAKCHKPMRPKQTGAWMCQECCDHPSHVLSSRGTHCFRCGKDGLRTIL